MRFTLLKVSQRFSLFRSWDFLTLNQSSEYSNTILVLKTNIRMSKFAIHCHSSRYMYVNHHQFYVCVNCTLPFNFWVNFQIPVGPRISTNYCTGILLHSIQSYNHTYHTSIICKSQWCQSWYVIKSLQWQRNLEEVKNIDTSRFFLLKILMVAW